MSTLSGGPSSLADRVLRRLRDTAYRALKNVTCECPDEGGVVVLRGRLPTYYLKQMAQAVAAREEGAKRVENRIEVVPLAPRDPWFE